MLIQFSTTAGGYFQSSNGIKEANWCDFLDAAVIDSTLKAAHDAAENEQVTPASNIFAAAYKYD